MFEAFGWMSNGSDRDIFNDHISVFKVGFSMLGTEVNVKFNCFKSCKLALSWFNSVMSFFILKTDFL